MFLMGLNFVEFGQVEKDGEKNAKSAIIIEILTSDPGIVTEIAHVIQADKSFKSQCTGQQIGSHHGHMRNPDQVWSQPGKYLVGVGIGRPSG